VRLAEAYRLTGQVGLTAQVERLSARVEELERQARKDSSTSSRPPSSDSPYRKNGTNLWIEVSDNVYEIRARCVLATRAASPGRPSRSSAARKQGSASASARSQLKYGPGRAHRGVTGSGHRAARLRPAGMHLVPHQPTFALVFPVPRAVV
jgi:hypothetical protein